MKKLIVYLSLALVALTVGTHNLFAVDAAQSSPKVEIESTIDRIIAIATSYSGDDKRVSRREKLREIISPKFDFDEMAKRSLGSQWSSCSADEQAEFVKLFSDLLADTYLDKIETVKPGMVKVDSENITFPKALVKTSVKHKGDVFPLDYRLMSKDGAWKVYDVIIENIGLVANYRSEFAGIIRKEKFSGLLRKLKDKTAKS